MAERRRTASDHEGVRFALLGPVRVHRHDGAALPVGPPKQQAMLAALALTPGHALPMTALTEALWGAEMPVGAVSAVRTYAWRLRRLLATAGAGEDVLVSAGDGYRLAVAPSAVDASQAEELAAAARDALDAGEPAQARLALSEALGMWSGEPLAGVPGFFAERSRSRLTDLHVALTEQYLETELRLGHHQQAQPRITELIARHPLRERPYVLLMRALYGLGRQVDALEVFRDARRLLVETYGVEPGAELTGTHERILRGDGDLAPALAPAELATPAAAEPAAAAEPDPAGPPVPAQLPPDLPDFTGRAAPTAELEAVLTAAERSSPAVLAISGMSGIGKTSLAVHLAHRVREHYPDGQLHVNLHDSDGTGAALSSAGLLGLLLAGLGVAPGQVPESPAERRGLLRSLTDGRRVLILLDDVSHGAQIRDVLPGTPGCAVLVTSRTRLDGLPLHAQLTLEVFDSDEALDLLRQGIGAARVAAEPAEALALVTACGRLPLAIRVVASRLAARPRRSLRSMAERLEDQRRRIAELSAGPLAVEAVFEVGYLQLPAPQAHDFVLLAAVAGAEFTLPEAAAVLGLEPAEAELRMESLVDAAILDEPYPGRFRYHDLLHLFALGRGTDPAEEGRALGRLLGLLLATARTAFALAVPGDPTGDVLGQDPPPEPGMPIADLRAARAWVAGARGVIVTVCDKVVELGAAAPVRAAVDLLIALSPFADELRHGRLVAVARDLAEAAARDAERSPDSPGHQRTAGRAEFLCSTVALRRGRPGEADTHARRAVHSASAGHDPVILRQALNDLGLVAQLRHDYALAVTCFDRATALARDLGHHSGAVTSGLNSAFARVRAGDPDRAVTDGEQALAMAGELGDDAGGTFALYVLGLAHHARKDYDVAAERFIAAARRSRAAGIRSREAQARYRLADTLLALGRPGEALDQARTALRHCEDLGAERDQAQALMVLGRILAETGRAAAASDRFGRARALFAALGLPEEEEAARLAGG